MNVYKFKPIFSILMAAAFEFLLLYVVAVLLAKTKGYMLNDVLFVEGIASIIIGIFLSMAGNTKGLSILSMGRNVADITGKKNLRITEMENKNFKDYFKCAVSFTFNAVSLIGCGIVCAILNFII